LHLPSLPSKAIPVDIRSIDDTSNFDEFPDIDLSLPVVHPQGGGMSGGPGDALDTSGRDWVFLNYTFKRFDGLTQRGDLRERNKTTRPYASQAVQQTSPPSKQ
jgi:serine/threonine kinase 38